MTDTQLTSVKVAHASFWYTKDDRMGMAFRGEEIEVNAEDYERGVKFDAFQTDAPADEPTDDDDDSTAEPDEFDPAKGGDIPATLAYVGDDKDKAAAMLELEQGRDKPRTTLVAELEKTLAAEA